MKDDIICALSGITPTEEETDNSYKKLPEGWIEITVKRNFPNSQYVILQELKAQAFNLTLAQIPEDQREMAYESIRVQVDAQYAAYEKTQKEFLTEKDTIYISPPENDAAILAEYQKLYELLGFDALLYEEENDENEDTDNAEQLSADPKNVKEVAADK